MTLEEAIAYIDHFSWSRWRLGLERATELLHKLGDPQKQLQCIHVAGSNGKGSTCAMLERILREAGMKTGFFPSPYIEDFRERIRVNGEYISEEALTRITDRVRKVADAMEDHPSQFELITAIGMLYFVETECDLVVLEVGMGGAYDATNVIDAPEVAVLTNIGLEHTEYLGNTLTEIAQTKAGIIKSGCDVVCYPSDPEVLRVVREICTEKGCTLQIADFTQLHLLQRSFAGQEFCWGDEQKGYHLALLGSYQLRNAAVVLTVIDVLRNRGWKIPEEAVFNGLKNVHWPARFEVLQEEPLFILDGGHNPQCAYALIESLEEVVFPETAQQRVILLIGLLKDKKPEVIFSILREVAAEFVCVTPDSERAIPAEELAAQFQKDGAAAAAYTTIEDGVHAALQKGKEKALPVVAFGSLYMAGTIRKVFKKDR